jgi:TRAP-type C4-dicarboxylate transport system substrate-binding protein
MPRLRGVSRVLIGCFIVILATGLVFVNASPVMAKEKIRLKVGMAKPIQAGKGFSIVKTIFVKTVTERVAAETDYEIEWVEAYGGTVAKDGEVLEAVQMGMLDIGYVIFLFEPAKLFLHNFGYFVPFSSPDQVMVKEISNKLFTEFPAMTEVFEKQYGQKMLCVVPATSYQLITTFPVKSIDDLKGRKIAAGGPNLIAVKPLGAAPVQSAIGEAYTSLKTGVYDGWLILESIMAGLKWPEVAPYVTIVDLGAPPAAALTINQRTWRKLPPEVQNIVRESAVLLSDQGASELAASGQAVRAALVKMGAKVSTLDPAERQRWAERLPDAAKAKAMEADKKGLPGTELIQRYIQLQEKNGYVFPRKWLGD